MEILLIKSKVEIDRSLQPYFEMLESRHLKMTADDWRQLVERTAAAVCEKPEQYLAQEISINQDTKQVIRDVFNDFMMTLDS